MCLPSQTQYMDVVAFNRYNAWYANPGNLDSINASLSEEIQGWYSAHSKPVMITEYGAGAIAGIHKVQAVLVVFTQSLQYRTLRDKDNLPIRDSGHDLIVSFIRKFHCNHNLSPAWHTVYCVL